jgi:hypothetical protein
MSDPRRRAITAGQLSFRPADAPERWEVSASAEDAVVEAPWGDWVRLARRILDADALSRDLEARGDAWDQGHAAGVDDGAGGTTPNPFR